MREVYILAGQSNMMGRGSLTPPQTYANAGSIYRYSQPWDATYAKPVNAASPGAGSWDAAQDPLHAGPLAGVGPGMAFADRLIDLREDPEMEVGLVPCAWAGTEIDGYGWFRGLRVWNAYGSLVARAHAAKAWGPIKGLLWYQGEADAKAASMPFYWVSSVYDLIQKFRVEIGILDLPVIATQIGPNPGSPYTYWNHIQGYQGQMAGCSPTVAVVSASDLTTNAGDAVHLNAASAVTLGHRYADAMHAMFS